MCAGRRPTDIPTCLSQFLFSATPMAPAFRNKGSHTRVRLSVLVLHTQKVSEQQDSVTGPDTVITSMTENSACLLEKSPKAAAQAQSSLWLCNRDHRGRAQPRKEEGEHRFTPTAVDVSSVPQWAEAVVFVQSLWDTRAPVLARLGVTRV